MTETELRISFYCPVWIENKPVIKQGVHIIVDDECKVRLDKKDSRLSDAQLWTLECAVDKNAPKEHLLYMSRKWLEGRFDEHDGKIPLHCPVCGRDYILTQEAYEDAFKKFSEGDPRLVGFG